MDESEFKTLLEALRDTNSRNEKKELIADVSDSAPSISFLSGSEFDDAGLGKKTVLDVAQDVFGDDIDGKPTVSESLESEDSEILAGSELDVLHNHMKVLADLSGNDQKAQLETMFETFDYPSIVAHACLNDWPTGVGNSTIGVKDSLPFYDGVHEIAAAEDRLTQPVVGRSFKPMLAVPESRGEPDNPAGQLKIDGYRAMVHVKETNAGQEISVYSRRMNEITESVPELTEVDWPAGEYILDGEVIAQTGSYSDTSARIGRKAENVDREIEMDYAVFDTIVYAGENMWQQPYKKRHGRLESLDLNTGPNVQRVAVYEDVEEAKDFAAELGEEGVIVKDWESEYEFDQRSASWQKCKMDDESVDLKIAGFEEGEGKASGTLGRVGVYVGNSGSGFTDEQRDTIWNNQSEWMGRCVEIEARGLGTENKLRMPIFVKSRHDDGEADSWERVKEIMREV